MARTESIQSARGDWSVVIGTVLAELAADMLTAGEEIDVLSQAYLQDTLWWRVPKRLDPEDWDDADNDGTCNNGEAFEDANSNGTWDANAGTDGIGGARDAVLYAVTIDYPRLFPIYAFLPGQSNTFSLTTNTVLRNQPYDAQSVNPNPPTGNCTE